MTHCARQIIPTVHRFTSVSPVRHAFLSSFFRDCKLLDLPACVGSEDTTWHFPPGIPAIFLPSGTGVMVMLTLGLFVRFKYVKISLCGQK